MRVNQPVYWHGNQQPVFVAMRASQSALTARPVGVGHDTLSFSGRAFDRLKQARTVEEIVAAFPAEGPPPFNAGFHAGRRALFLSMLPANTTVILPGAMDVTRNSDVSYPWRQESNFHYLTGVDRPDALAVLSNVPGKPFFTLVLPKRDYARETWNGERISEYQARTKYRADKVVAYDNTGLSEGKVDSKLEKALNEAVRGGGNVQFLAPTSLSALKPVVANFLKRNLPPGAPPITSIDTDHARAAIDSLRLIKTPWEQALLRRACTLSAESHSNAMRTLKLANPGQTLYEGKVQGTLEKWWLDRGAARVGYGTIAGGGKHSCVLHYVDNRTHSRWGDLMLVDAGGEYGYQTADITRTWPVNGTFTPEQRAIYELVLKAQEAGIRMIRPGVTMGEIHRKCARILTQGLLDLGILKGDPQKLFKDGKFRDYFMHRTSHFLGMDVHDVPSSGSPVLEPLKKKDSMNLPLRPGMVITVEPGLYFDPRVVRQNGIDPKWAKIGVRIEDDILVTPNGHEVLSAAVPKHPDEIEALMQGR